MKQIERIRRMSLRNLAVLLVYMETVNEGDYDLDENPIDYYVDYYVCPDGQRFDDMSYEDAIDHTVEWLQSEV